MAHHTTTVSTCLFILRTYTRSNIKRNALVAQDIKGDDTQTVVISKDLHHYAALPVYYCYSNTYYIYSFTVRTDWASSQYYWDILDLHAYTYY